MSLESRKYLASVTDIEQITREVLQAQAAGSSGRASYLKSLVAVTRQERGITAIRKHTQPIGHEERSLQIDALEAVHAKFYAIVIRTIGKCPALELNRKSNFARSAKSTLRSWIKAGNDIGALDPAKVTKRMLAVETRKRRIPSTHILTKRAKRYLSYFDDVVSKMADADRSTAAETIGFAVEHLQAELARLGPVRAQRRAA